MGIARGAARCVHTTGVTSMYSETLRKFLHIGVVGLAFLLRFLTPVQAMLLAFGAVVMNALILPRVVGRWVLRPDEQRSAMPTGIVLYPVAVLTTIVCLPHRLDLVAGAWGILAVGDGMATLAGRAVGRRGPRWPWNPRKSVAGSLAFLVAGAAAASVLMHWTAATVTPPPAPSLLVWAPLAAAGVAMLVESIDLRVDDNLSVTFSAAATLWCLTLVDSASLHAAWPVVAGRMVAAVAVNAGAALVVMRARFVDAGGAFAGALVGIAIALGAGLPGWLMLLATVVAAAATSTFGERGKRAHGIAEERDGRRGAGNAIANCGIAAVAALLAVATPDPAHALMAMVAALVAGASDTVASEVGKAMRGTTYSVLSLSRVAPGTPGAMSAPGTLAGLVSAAALATMAAALGLIAPGGIAIVVGAATIGALVESLLAAQFETRGLLTNDLLNVLNTATGAAVAVALSR